MRYLFFVFRVIGRPILESSQFNRQTHKTRMAKSGGLFFATAALIMMLVVWGNPIPEIANSLLPKPPAPLPADSLVQPSTLDLRVDADRLMAHVEALSGPVSSPAQREAARQYITQQLVQYGLTATRQSYQSASAGSNSAEASTGVNIVAEVMGAEPAAGSIVLGAHYDTERDSPGADDNGSGVATLLESARIFSQQLAASKTPNAQSSAAHALPRNLKLVFFDQEERQPDGSGLLGSLAFTNRLDNLVDVKGAIILDMIGYACHTPGCQAYPAQLPLSNVPKTGDFLTVLGLQRHVDLTGVFMLSAQTTWPKVLTLPIPNPMLRLFPDLLRSDHAPFWEKDVPAVLVSDTANFRNPNYHTPQDTLDTLDTAFFKGSAQHVVNAIATLLNQR